MTINSEEKKNEATAEFLNSTDLVTLAQPIPIFFPDKATADSAELDSSSTETNKVFSTDVPIMMNTDITPPPALYCGFTTVENRPPSIPSAVSICT